MLEPSPPSPGCNSGNSPFQTVKSFGRGKGGAVQTVLAWLLIAYIISYSSKFYMHSEAEDYDLKWSFKSEMKVIRVGINRPIKILSIRYCHHDLNQDNRRWSKKKKIKKMNNEQENNNREHSRGIYSKKVLLRGFSIEQPE